VQALERLAAILSPYSDSGRVQNRLHDTVIANVPAYGYGVKSYTLSMIETALQVSGGRMTAAEIREVLGVGKSMLAAEVSLLPHVSDVIPMLAASQTLMLISKGDLAEQTSKLDRSGLASYFRHIEIVADKTRETYAAILARHGVAPDRFMMVGNSPRSDVLPVLGIGGCAVHVPYPVIWSHEDEDIPEDVQGRLFRLGSC
jgi:putative hydrolase of the HAD superfamily